MNFNIIVYGPLIYIISQIQVEMFEEMTEALSIHFSHSEDGSQFDFLSSPEKAKPTSKVKCFRCYGTSLLNCKECQGTQLITFNHPLSRLLEEVLVRKLHLGAIEEERSEQMERVFPIKEEEEDSDQKKVSCSSCERQCDVFNFFQQQLPPKIFCADCTQKSTNTQSEMMKNVRISDREMYVFQAMPCKSCKCQIQNCYSICKTCLSAGSSYQICGTCSDSHAHSHPPEHILQTAIRFDINRSGRMEMSCQIDLSSCNNSQTYHDQDLLDQAELLILNRTSSITTDVRYDQPVICMTDSMELNHKALLNSCVSLQIEGLFTSTDARNEINITALKPQKVSNTKQSEKRQTNLCKTSVRPSRADKQNLYYQGGQQQQANYIFVDYKCDRCERQPIINVRYHCKQCEDFDVCQACYPACKLHHEHYFEKIDGKQIREQALQKLFQTNLAQSNHKKLKRAGSCYDSMNLRQSFEAIN